ncbi:hypothetical protein COU37_03080 [Candidatus Micrarchaeota archaeon CG10_big_fil_rev_8_21_14_0_10_45_29]|nr:MAG: hypothetical protein COU37_03080 [Candidatus Micrarchaeota archaeon CG10_big_fil_rev_8_21_14_0_10_45_29]QBM01563.1 hypothetical protein [uncultured archaeon]
MPKKRKKAKAAEIYACCHDEIDHYERGKALKWIAIGLVLVMFGFGYITMEMLALIVGAIYCLVGIVKMMGKNC